MKYILWTLSNNCKVKFDYYPHISRELPWAMLQPGRGGWKKEVYLDLFREDKEEIEVKLVDNFIELGGKFVWSYLDRRVTYSEFPPHFKDSICGITVKDCSILRELEWLLDLFKRDKFWIFITDFRSYRGEPLPQFGSFCELGLRCGRVNDESIREFLKLPFLERVKWLSLGESSLSDDSIKSVLRVLKEIRWFGVGSNPITDKASEYLMDHKEIEWLGLGNTKISGKALRNIGVLNNLKLLWLANTMVEDDSLIYLREMSNLKVLGLNGCNITEIGISRLIDLPSIEVLFLNNTKINDIKILAKIPSLKAIGLKGLDFEFKDIQYIVEKLDLFYLEVDNPFLKDEDIKTLFEIKESLKAVESLEILYLSSVFP